ncbi:DUF3300 domain-containing protein [Pseudomonas mandelii]|uniref:DUF3300 domain-containing protein n=1 Tax=Pseudomonas mandelii TaxID=75612 RepID=UPI00224ABF87|nr:DUF3300 domain-containing protein [Pseudomonas mandelii]MCX2901631.1 DUF3300 domain-containing protein [Pseudomonas mandelii]
MRIPLICALSIVLFSHGPGCLAQPVDATPVEAPSSTTAKDAVFNQEQLDQILAPIALYPDPLLAQILMASTYPGELSEAVTWSKQHPKAKGDDAVKQVANQPWDPSVQALVAFPQVLAILGQDYVWVQRLGDAFLAQPDDTMQSVQRLRHQAQAAGNLPNNQHQNVTVQNVTAPAPVSSSTTASLPPASSSSTIIIQPTDPQVVYVPTYNPTTTYGTWPYPASPPTYYPPPPSYYPGSALVAGLAFGTGVAIIGSLWGDCDWDNNDIDIDVDRYNNINRNNQISTTQNKWQHNAVHRDGVPYRDNRSRQDYGRQLNGSDQRQAYRGDNTQRVQAREKARNSMEKSGFERPAASNRQARDQMREAEPGMAAGNRMQAGADRTGKAERGQGNAPNIREKPQSSRQDPQLNQRREDLTKTRQGAHQQPVSSRGNARNNAFAGVGSPTRSDAQASRGRASQASAQRQGATRSAGHQISRPSSPARSRGGRR